MYQTQNRLWAKRDFGAKATCTYNWQTDKYIRGILLPPILEFFLCGYKPNFYSDLSHSDFKIIFKI